MKKAAFTGRRGGVCKLPPFPRAGAGKGWRDVVSLPASTHQAKQDFGLDVCALVPNPRGDRKGHVETARSWSWTQLGATRFSHSPAEN